MNTGHRDCCSYYHGYLPGCATVYVPMVWIPAPQACCETITVPRDLDVDPSNASQQGLVGGASQISLTLEYLVETGASSPSVTLTTTSDGVSSTWSDTTPTVGYHVQQAVLSVAPGTKVSIDVNNVTARLRWCERVCC
jgi:hypothetical protein